jgi:hypothetical protein
MKGEARTTPINGGSKRHEQTVKEGKKNGDCQSDTTLIHYRFIMHMARTYERLWWLR